MSYFHWVLVLLNLSAAANIAGNLLVFVWGMLMVWSAIARLDNDKQINQNRLRFQKELFNQMFKSFEEERRRAEGKEPWQS